MDREYAEYLLRKVKEDYNLIADDFSRTRNAVWPETKFLFDKYLFKKAKVLDLGCGNGRYFEYLKEKEIDYFGIDISEKLIEMAKKKYPQANFQVADALHLPFSADFFDMVISLAVFHHIPSKEFQIQFLKEAKRVLKPKGIFILTVWNFPKLKEFFIYFKSFLLRLFGAKLDFGDFLEPWGKKVLRYYHYFSQGELRNLAKSVSLEVKEIGIIKNEKGTRRNTYLILEK